MVSFGWILLSLFLDNGISFKVKKDQKLYDYTDENREKVLKKDWDYDFW